MDSSSADPDIAPERIWTSLSSEEKRARVIRVAGELFAREGVEFPMPELAKAVGVGVGSLYRQLGSKDDVLAVLVIERLDAFREHFESVEGSDDPTQALIEVIRYCVDQTLQDRVAKISFELGLDRDDVRETRARAAAALQRLVDAAKASGGIRQDATAMDLRTMFRVAREAERIFPGGGRRISELVIDGLRA